MKVLIGGGGTGGHLVPGIALYQELKKQHSQVLYILSERDRAYDSASIILEEDRFFVSLSGISRKLSFNTIKQIFSIFDAWRKSYQHIKKFNPDVAIITGGYLSNIVALSAFLMRKPLYIVEQNSVAGITNRVWGLIAKKVFTTFPSPKFIPSHKVLQTGNPMLYKESLSIAQAKSLLGLASNTKLVLGISGGSQGAQKINDIVLTLIPKLIAKGYQIVWSLGTKEFERLQKENKLSFLEQYQDDVKAFRFITRMDAFWSVSTMVLARAGAGTVSEALFFKTPSLFVPIYQSPDNHQYLNAKLLSDLHCAEIIEEPSLTEETLLTHINRMMLHQSQYISNFPDFDKKPEQEIVSYLLP